MSDEVENDYEHITDNYKAREGTLNERLIYMKAMRQANLNMNNRYPGMKNNDVYFQMIDLDKGVFGHAFLVSLFIHVSIFFERKEVYCTLSWILLTWISRYRETQYNPA